MIIATHSLLDLESKITDLPKPRDRSQSGYGNRLPTRHMVRLPGSRRWRRVYVCIWSNQGTAYVLNGRDWIVIH